MHVSVKVGFVGEEKAVPNQTVNFTHEEDAGGMAVYVRRADCPHWNCVAVSSPDSLPSWISYRDVWVTTRLALMGTLPWQV